MLDSGEPNQPIESTSTPEQGVEIEYLFPFDWGTIQMTEGFLQATSAVPLAVPGEVEAVSNRWVQAGRDGLPAVNVILMSESDLAQLPEVETSSYEGNMVEQATISHPDGIDVLLVVNPDLAALMKREFYTRLQEVMELKEEEILAILSSPSGEDIKAHLDHELIPTIVPKGLGIAVYDLVSRSVENWLDASIGKGAKRSALLVGATAVASSALTTSLSYKLGPEGLRSVAYASTLYGGGVFGAYFYWLSHIHKPSAQADASIIATEFGKGAKNSLESIFSREEFDQKFSPES